MGNSSSSYSAIVPKKWWLVVLQLYADTSGKATSAVWAAAGYIAEEKQWKHFNKEWQRALDEAKVSAFHATDFFNYHGEFKGWNEDPPKHEKFAKRFTAIAEKQTEVGFARGLEVEPYQRLMAPAVRGLRSAPQREMTPLMMCASKLLHDIASMWRPHRGPIAALFEREHGIGQAIDYFNYLQYRIRAPWTKAFVTVETGGKELLPLQAADLLAHESWRRMKEYIKPSGRLVRKSMQRLLKHSGIEMRMFTEADIAAVVPRIRAYMLADKLY